MLVRSRHADTQSMGGTVVAVLAAVVVGQGANTSVHNGILEQRRALAALTGTSAPSYRRTLAHVNSALAALRAAESALSARARVGTLPNVNAIEGLLDQALSADTRVAALINGALPFVGRGVPLPPASLIRTDLRQGLTAAVSLGKLTAGL